MEIIGRVGTLLTRQDCQMAPAPPEGETIPYRKEKSPPEGGHFKINGQAEIPDRLDTRPFRRTRNSNPSDEPIQFR